MRLVELWGVLTRRWYLVALAAAVAGGAGYAVTEQVPPDYTMTAEVLLLPPPTSVQQGDNPYLALGGLTPAGDVLARSMTDTQTLERVLALGATADYRVELDSTSPAPILLVTVEANAAAAAGNTLSVVLDQIPDTLVEVQQAANVPSNAFITSSPVTREVTPTKSVKPQLRALIVAVGGSLVLSLMAIAGLDGLLRRRSLGRLPGRGADTDSNQTHTTRLQESALPENAGRQGDSNRSQGVAAARDSQSTNGGQELPGDGPQRVKYSSHRKLPGFAGIGPGRGRP